MDTEYTYNQLNQRTRIRYKGAGGGGDVDFDFGVRRLGGCPKT
jgi:hypothetical protein